MKQFTSARYLLIATALLSLAACGGGEEPPPQPLPAVEIQAVWLEPVSAEFEFVARAELSRAATSLEVAQRNLTRGEKLAPQGHVSASEMDKLRGDRDSALAAKSAAEAAVEQARLNLEFTEIRAPFTGMAGRSQLSIGDLADPSASPLVTLMVPAAFAAVQHFREWIKPANH